MRPSSTVAMALLSLKTAVLCCWCHPNWPALVVHSMATSTSLLLLLSAWLLLVSPVSLVVVVVFLQRMMLRAQLRSSSVQISLSGLNKITRWCWKSRILLLLFCLLLVDDVAIWRRLVQVGAVVKAIAPRRQARSHCVYSIKINGVSSDEKQKEQLILSAIPQICCRRCCR